MKTLIKKILVFSPLLAILVFVNYHEDPANVFKGFWYEKDMARIMLNGLNVANVTDYDERLLQKFYIEGLKDNVDVIALGSSTSMHLRSDLFPGMKFFNSGVSGACLEDYIAIYEIYHENKIKPKIIIMGVDPWLLNKNNGQIRWESIASYYEKFMSREMSDRKSSLLESFVDREKLFRIKKYLQLFSLSYFQNSVKHLFRMVENRSIKADYYPTSLTALDVHIRLSDGSFSDRSEYRLKPISEILKDAIRAVEIKSMYSLGDFRELDKGLIFKFERFVNYLSGEGIEVIFFLPPYHPYIYNYMINTKEYRIILEAESYFKKFAKLKDIYIIGSYDPGAIGFGEEDFFDTRHAKTESCKNLFKKNLKSRRVK